MLHLLMGFFVSLGFSQANLFSGTDLRSGKWIQVPSASYNVVAFLSARCPCSKGHEKVLKEMSKKYAGFSFVGVHSNLDEPETDVRAHFSSTDFPFPVLQDTGQKLANRFGAFKTPHVFVLNQSQEVVFSGGVDNSVVPEAASEHYLEEALQALNAGKPPAKKEVRALGCVIQRI